jgi:hypothetical protein
MYVVATAQLMDLAENELSDTFHEFSPIALLFLYDLFNRFAENVVIRSTATRHLCWRVGPRAV